MSSLAKKNCTPCESDVQPLSDERVRELLHALKGWSRKEKGIAKSFSQKNYKETIGFTVRVAMLAEEEGHHPDMTVRYSGVDVVLWTHSIGGLSENDFILAAKIDSLFGKDVST